MEKVARRLLITKDGEKDAFMVCDECDHDHFEVTPGWWCDDIICARCGNYMPDPGFGAM